MKPLPRQWRHQEEKGSLPCAPMRVAAPREALPPSAQKQAGSMPAQSSPGDVTSPRLHAGVAPTTVHTLTRRGQHPAGDRRAAGQRGASQAHGPPHAVSRAGRAGGAAP